MTETLDINKSIIAANGNVSLAKDLYKMLIDDLGKRLDQIESSFQNNDMENLGEHAHKLFGATAYCIVPKLRISAEALDHALHNKKFDQLNELVANIQQEIKRLILEGPEHLELNWNEYV